MKLSATIKALKKNILKTLTMQDVLSHEIHPTKRKLKWDKFFKALKNTTHLTAIKLVEYTKPTSSVYQPIATLANLLKALADNTSVELLDISHNHLDEATVEAIAELLQQPGLPLQQLFIDYINHSSQVNLQVIIDTLENHATLQKLSLQNNELTTETCKSLLNVIMSNSNTIKEISLSHCTIAAEDLKKLQAAALAKGNKFVLSLDAVGITNANQQNDSHKNNDDASYLKIKTILAPIATTRFTKSEGDVMPSPHTVSISSPSTVTTTALNLPLAKPKSQSENDISYCFDNAMKLSFKK